MFFGRASVLLLRVLIILLFATAAIAQQNCPLPPAIQAVPPGVNIFSDQQEVDLGDAMAETLGQRVKVIHDDLLNAYLQALGERVAQHLPPTQLKFRFYLIEFPEVNAFGIAGGRVYVARKMVAETKTEDELAGVLAHELGHIVTHQSAIAFSARLREVLGVTKVGDRADVFEKFHQFLENEARTPKHTDRGEEGQYVADQVALYAMARAGYAPHAYVDLWDRYQQTHGKRGNWLSDIFGSTKPSQRRLREMLKNLSALPPGCAEITPGSRMAEFAKWQSEVINYSGTGGAESLPGLVFKQALSKPLRPDISNLRFSPDGKYVLAQDEGGIHVLTRDPFAVLFYIPAVDGRDAVFSPDSQSVVFHTSSLRVESWSVREQKRNWAHELTVLHPCIQTELSPDGSTLACLNLHLELSLIDVATGKTLVTKKSFIELTWYGACLGLMALSGGNESQLVAMRFSPDGRYFLAGSSTSHFAWNVGGQREFSLPGSINDVLKLSFTFIGPDRIVGVNWTAPTKSPVLAFPSGQRLSQLILSEGIKLKSAAHGDYFFVSPLKNAAMGLIDVQKGGITLRFKNGASDIYDGLFLVERLTGELVLRTADKMDMLASVRLPQARLGHLQAVAVSPDFNWLLLSNRSRGAVWDLAHNIQTMDVRTFHGAWVDRNQVAYVDFPKFGDTDRQVVRIDPALGNSALAFTVADATGVQHGPYFLFAKPRYEGKGGKDHALTSLAEPELFCTQALFFRNFSLHGENAVSNQDIELRDVRDGHKVWSRYFPREVPDFSFAYGKVLLRWPLSQAGGRDEMAKFPDLKTSLDTADYFLEEVDLEKDAIVGKLVIKTNNKSFRVMHVFAEGDWVIASATGDQVLTYSLSTGQQKGHFFGSYPSASGNGILALESESSRLSLYDLATSQLKEQYTFADPISFKTFSADGKRLFVMTVSQTAYILDVTATK